MATRRSRISIRPNIGTRGNKAQTKRSNELTPPVEDSSEHKPVETKVEEKEDTGSKQNNNVKTETEACSKKDSEEKNQDEVKKTDVTPAASRRRSRIAIKPRITPRAVSKSGQDSPKDGNDAVKKPLLDCDIVQMTATEDVQAGSVQKLAGDSVELVDGVIKIKEGLPVDKGSEEKQHHTSNDVTDAMPITKSPRAEKSMESNSCPKLSALSPEHMKDADPETAKDVSKPAVRVRSRFMKARPNLAEAGRARIRHSALPGGEQEDGGRRRSTNIRTSISEDSVTPVVESAKGSNNSVQEESHQTETVVVEAIPSGAVVTAVKPAERIPVKTITKAYEKEEREVIHRKKMVWLDEPIDRTKMTMKDFIYMNPKCNPMKKTLDQPEKQRKDKEEKRKVTDTPEKEDATSNADVEILSSAPGGGDEEQDVDKKKLTAGKEDPMADEEDEAMPVPQVTIGPDGQIILNEESLVIDTVKEKNDTQNMELIHEREDSLFTSGYSRKSQTKLWSERETKKFYLALSAVGTDFSLMVNLFPNRSRTELKRKFKREEKINKYLIDKAIRERLQFDQDFFDELKALDTEAEDKAAKNKLRSRRAHVQKAKLNSKKGEDNGDEEYTAPNEARGQKRNRKSTAKEGGPKKTKQKKRKKMYNDSESEEEYEVVALEDDEDEEEILGTKVDGENLPPDECISDEEDIITSLHKPTRAGRQPRPVKSYSEEQPEVRCKKKTKDIQTMKGADSEPMSPPPIPRNPLSPPCLARTPERTRKFSGASSGSRTPGQFISLSNLSNVANVNVNQMQPGSLLFVTSGSSSGAEGEKADGSGVIHVYLVSDQGGIQTAGGIQPAPSAAAGLASPNGAVANGLSVSPGNTAQNSGQSLSVNQQSLGTSTTNAHTPKNVTPTVHMMPRATSSDGVTPQPATPVMQSILKTPTTLRSSPLQNTPQTVAGASSSSEGTFSPKLKSILKSPPVSQQQPLSPSVVSPPKLDQSKAIVIDAREMLFSSGDAMPACQTVDSDSEGEYLIIDPSNGSIICSQGGSTVIDDVDSTEHIYLVSDDPHLIQHPTLMLEEHQ